MSTEDRIIRICDLVIIVCLIVLICLSLTGCIDTTAKVGKAQLTTRRLMADTDIETVKVNPDGSFELTGYRSELSRALQVAEEALKRVPVAP